MLVPPGALHEPLPAVPARVGLLAGVDALVGLHVVLLHEGLAAEPAGEGLLVEVDLLVPPLGAGRGELLAADRAPGLGQALVGLQVEGEVLLADHLVANLALGVLKTNFQFHKLSQKNKIKSSPAAPSWCA